MFENVVVGIDGGEGGREAVLLARQLASSEARVTVAHVYGEALLHRASGIPLSDEREDSRALLDRERDAWPTADPASIYATSIGRGLHELAVERSADLLVVGSCHHGMIGRVLMGDDTRASFNGAPCAIAIAPRGYAPRQDGLATLGVGYDSSPDSERALAAARALAARTGATIKALRVVSWEDVREHAPLPADWPEAATAIVDEIQRQLRAIDGVQAKAVDGGPREELVKLSRHADLLIVGSRGYGPFGSVFHGSVSSYLERHVECSLLVLPRELARQDEPAPQRAERVAVPA